MPWWTLSPAPLLPSEHCLPGHVSFWPPNSLSLLQGFFGNPGALVPKRNTSCLCNPSCRHCLGCPGRTAGVSSIHVGALSAPNQLLQTNFFRVVPCCVYDRTGHYPLRSNLFLVAKGVGLSWCVNLCENQQEAPLWADITPGHRV